MVSSNARSVPQYLAALPSERRDAIAAMRDVILKHLPEGYVETMQAGMIGYCVPLSRFENTHNGAPLMAVALAAQKHHMAVYLMGIYADPKLREWFEANYCSSGKRLDIGKCCVRFKKLDDVPLGLVGEAVARMPVERFLELYRSARADRTSARKAKNLKSPTNPQNRSHTPNPR